jgi:hypothetical protein
VAAAATSEIEEKTEHAELERLKSEIDKAQASGQTDQKRQSLINFADELISEMEDLVKSKP